MPLLFLKWVITEKQKQEKTFSSLISLSSLNLLNSKLQRKKSCQPPCLKSSIFFPLYLEEINNLYPDYSPIKSGFHNAPNGPFSSDSIPHSYAKSLSSLSLEYSSHNLPPPPSEDFLPFRS